MRSRTATTVVAVPATATNRSRKNPEARNSSKNGRIPSRVHWRAHSSSRSEGGSEARNFSVTRRHPMSNERARTGSPPARPATTSVEPPPMSTTSRRSPKKSHDAPANDNAASRAGDHRKLDAALGKQVLELARVACVARRRRGDSRHSNGTPRPLETGKHLLVARDGVQHAAHGLGPEHARGVHAFAEVRDGVLAIKLAQKPLLVDVGNEHTAGHCADVDGGIATGTDSAPSGPLRHVGQHGPRRALRHVPHASLLYSTPNSGSRRVEYHVSGASMLSETMLARNVDPSSGRSRPRTLAVSSPSFTQPNCS